MEGLTRESLRPLLDLQDIDSTVERLNQRKADLPEQRELDELVAERRAAAGEQDAAKGAFDTAATQQGRLESEVAMLTDKIKQESERLYGGDVTSPKELSNIQAELDALRRRKSHVEDQLLEAMEQRESAESLAGDTSGRVEELDAKIAQATERRDTASVEIERELAELQERRTSITPTVPPEALELYEDLRGRKGGVGVAALKQGVCMGCNVSLSPMALDEIRRSDDPLVRCENCRRMLVVL